MKISKSGIISASGSGINENLCTWSYSLNPLFPSNAGNTVLNVEQFPTYTRYTPRTVGNDGGRYGYPAGSGIFVKGNKYSWSIEARASIPITFVSSNARLGFEGGGMLRGSQVVIGTDWTTLSNTWIQQTSQAFVFYPSGELTEGNWIDLRNLKLELADHPTPFTLPHTDSRYVSDNMGFIEAARPVHFGNDWVQGIELLEV